VKTHVIRDPATPAVVKTHMIASHAGSWLHVPRIPHS
jgi:hypothetical protein